MFVFFYGFQNDLLCIFPKMSLVVFVQFFYINRFTVFHYYMTGFDLWKMCLKDFCGMIHGNGNNGTVGFAGNLKASFVEGKKFCLILCLVSGSFRKDADGNSGFDFVNGSQDGLQSLLDVLTVKEQAVEILHPVGQKRDLFHFFFCDIAGTDRAAAVGKKDIKIASVISDVKNRSVFWNIFFSNDCDPGSGNPQDKFEGSLDYPE